MYKPGRVSESARDTKSFSLWMFTPLYYVMPCQAVLCHATAPAMPCLAFPCLALIRRAVPCHAMPCHAMPEAKELYILSCCVD